MFITEPDIELLTGYTYPKYQLQWLKEQGIKFTVNHEGKPVVLASYLEVLLGAKAKKKKATDVPNYEAFSHGTNKTE